MSKIRAEQVNGVPTGSGGGGGSGVFALNDGFTLGLFGSFNFHGPGVTASATGIVADIYIVGGGTTGAQGPQGSPGVTGPAGAPQGSPGVTGAQGPQGSPGVTGAIGPQGSPGVTGVQGQQGSPGVTGTQGEQGSPGVTGTQGIQGSPGVTGTQGIQGSPGVTGTQGIQGSPGVTGPAGADGVAKGVDYYYDAASDIPTYEYMLRTLPLGGEVDESATCTGSAGNFGTPVLIDQYVTLSGDPNITILPAGAWEFDSWAYVDAAAGNSRLYYEVYTRTSGGTETLLFSLGSSLVNATSAGTPDHLIDNYFYPTNTSIASTTRIVVKVYAQTDAAGSRTVHLLHAGTTHASHVTTPITQGLPGATGPTGPMGPQGSPGVTGTQGQQGSPGVTGAIGPQGQQGSPGVTGAQGIQGSPGVTGTQGVQGSPGVTGTQGAQGSPGVTGTQGPQGSPGVTGPAGQDGGGSSGIYVLGESATLGLFNSINFHGPGVTSTATGMVADVYIFGGGGSGTQGPQGSPGVTGTSGQNAYNSTPTYTQNNSTLVTVVSGAYAGWEQLGQAVYIGTGGYYVVTGISGTNLVLANLASNLPSGTVINAANISPGGIPGITGATGTQGNQGSPGATGTQGVQGSPGVTGTQGSQGSPGVTGTQGSQGSPGVTGTQGVQGSPGVTGAIGQNAYNSTPTYTQNNSTLVTVVSGAYAGWEQLGQAVYIGTGGYYVVTGISGTNLVLANLASNLPSGTIINSANISPGGIPGVTGAGGAQGNQGSPGVTGSQGNQGSPGVTGTQGSQGSPGVTGTQGQQGSPGVTGATGQNAYNFTPTYTQNNSTLVTVVSGAYAGWEQLGQAVYISTGGYYVVTGISGTNLVLANLASNLPSGTVINAANISPGGIPGVTGAGGAQGNQGSPGVTGTQGSQGSPGVTGSQGIQGSPGVTGSQGIQGSPGVTGTQGSQGSPGVTGATGQNAYNSTPTYTQNNSTLVTVVSGAYAGWEQLGQAVYIGTGGYYVVTGISGTNLVLANLASNLPSGTIINAANISPGGIPGVTGAGGAQGNQGSPGVTGSQGVQGSPGVTGSQGIQGSPGVTGTQGVQGSPGVTGTQGQQGSPGVTGATGQNAYNSTPTYTQNNSTLVTVVSGAYAGWEQLGQAVYISTGGYYVVTGISGTNLVLANLASNLPSGTIINAANISPGGIPGVTGAGGAQGNQGSPGVTGTQGAQGSPGVTGTQGAQGSPGVTGTQGNQGSPGVTGTQGIQGSPGVTGATGQNAYNSTPTYTQNNSTLVTVVSGAYAGWEQLGQAVYIGTGGYYVVTGISGTNLVLANLASNLPSGTIINAANISPGGIPGVTGAGGAQGNQGSPGVTGSQGIQGSPGVTGAQGVQGSPGVTGPAGEGGGGSGIFILDDNANVGLVNTINFAGAGVSAVATTTATGLHAYIYIPPNPTYATQTLAGNIYLSGDLQGNNSTYSGPAINKITGDASLLIQIPSGVRFFSGGSVASATPTGFFSFPAFPDSLAPIINYADNGGYINVLQVGRNPVNTLQSIEIGNGVLGYITVNSGSIIDFSVGNGQTVVQVLGPSFPRLSMVGNIIEFNGEVTASGPFRIMARPSSNFDYPASDLILDAAPPRAGNSTNKSAGNIVLAIPEPILPQGSYGSIDILNGSSGGYTQMAEFGRERDGGAPYFGLWGPKTATGAMYFQVQSGVASYTLYWPNARAGTSGYVLSSDTAGNLFWGAPGSQGATGPQGPQGSPGVTGSQGPQGSPGVTGSQGATGSQGLQGSPGVTGTQGPQGDQGSPGVTGTQGAPGAQGSPGQAIWVLNEGATLGQFNALNLNGALVGITGPVANTFTINSLNHFLMVGMTGANMQATTAGMSGAMVQWNLNYLAPTGIFGHTTIATAAGWITIAKSAFYQIKTCIMLTGVPSGVSSVVMAQFLGATGGSNRFGFGSGSPIAQSARVMTVASRMATITNDYLVFIGSGTSIETYVYSNRVAAAATGYGGISPTGSYFEIREM